MAYNGYVYVWLESLGYLSLISSGSEKLDQFLTRQQIPLKAVKVVEHLQGSVWEWAEIHVMNQLSFVIIAPQNSGPFLSNRKVDLLTEFANVVGYTKPIRIAA